MVLTFARKALQVYKLKKLFSRYSKPTNLHKYFSQLFPIAEGSNSADFKIEPFDHHELVRKKQHARREWLAS